MHVIGTERAELVRDDQRLTRPIGEAAFEHRFQAIRSSSATGVDEILAIFPANLAGALIETELVSEWRTIEDLP
ncbi:MAG: hypothetical protein JWO37_2112 [Acidimicrobiales bacterium]|nr:hypothetical protein [Acidimicrobiales bacterium]